MAEHPFPWLSESVPGDAPAPSPAPERGPDGRPAVLRKFGPYAIAAAVLLALAVSRGSAGREGSSARSSLDVLVVMSPIPKGAEVWPEILKEIPVDPSSLTKTQALQVLRPQDLQNLRGKLRARKNLPPNKPLFWSDLDFVPPGARPESPGTAVYFPKEVK